jgi:hypothetical protein
MSVRPCSRSLPSTYTHHTKRTILNASHYYTQAERIASQWTTHPIHMQGGEEEGEEEEEGGEGGGVRSDP